MDEAISRQEVIKKLDEALESIIKNVSKESDVYHIVYVMFGIVKRIILTIPPEPHWIPVEQDSPKIGEYVLCRTKARAGKYHVCKFVDKDKWVDRPHFDWNHNGFPHVIAWTRFKPYKGETT